MAVAKGFCSAQDVAQALKIQAEADRKGDKHQLLGIIMIREGLLSTDQLIQMLKAQELVQGQAPAEPS